MNNVMLNKICRAWRNCWAGFATVGIVVGGKVENDFDKNSTSARANILSAQYVYDLVLESDVLLSFSFLGICVIGYDKHSNIGTVFNSISMFLSFLLFLTEAHQLQNKDQ